MLTPFFHFGSYRHSLLRRIAYGCAVASAMIILLSSMQKANALEMPSYSTPFSPYVQEVMQTLEERLGGLESLEGGECADDEGAVLASEIANAIAQHLNDVQLGKAESYRDIHRSVCFVYDIRIMEDVLVELIRSAVESAASCQPDVAQGYLGAIEYLWEKLWQVRVAGLDPQAQMPIDKTASGELLAPSDASSASDDTVCPYTSAYAPIGINGVGCNEEPEMFAGLPASFPEEMELLQGLFSAVNGGTSGIAYDTRETDGLLNDIRSTAYGFVSAMSWNRLPGAPFLSLHNLSIEDNSAAGESGCLGWPSDVGDGVVEGSATLHMNPSGDISSRSMQEAIEFIRMRESERWLEYVRSLNREIQKDGAGSMGYGLPLDDLEEINRDHVHHETQYILGIRDPQVRMANMAESLHNASRIFASHAVVVNEESSMAHLPVLRSIVHRLSTFLAGMCTNRGCNSTIARAIELSLRDECFPSFTAEDPSQDVYGLSTLEPCRAQYAE